MHTKRLLNLLLIALALCTSCAKKKVNTQYSMYYWRTTFELSEGERAWMDSIGVQTLYVRLFDVIKDSRDKELGMMPDATIRGLKSLGSLQADSTLKRCIPVVFVAPGVITKNDEANAEAIASRLLQRIDAITEGNGLGICDEIQIDYDWAQSNQKAYFAMLRVLASKLHGSNRKLSTTIRLHQLALEAPPVDRGMLMLYNTGKLQSMEETNSILTREAVEPYLRHLSSYALPLSVALPDFSWNAVFRNNEFAFLAPGLQLSDTTMFVQLDSTHWQSRFYQSIPLTASATVQSSERLLPGDIIRREESDAALNRELLDRMSNLRSDIAEEVVYFR